ncbi:hypothetical protein [Streptomyces sp. 135]|uniref:hypothetical protein n=1 Tax=Streptomyces sp. 135 TaxID=2838850 RepID=UPI001CBE065D|nr:hypothetical protein [Streptomyces sp. 135]
MEKIRTAYAWARAHKRTVLAVAAAGLTVAAGYIPGLPVDDIVNGLGVLLGA